MRYGIIGAMEEEVEAVKQQIDINEEVKIANSTFYTGTYEGIELVLLQSGIGKVNAALSTTILHERFKPDVVLNTGSAGGTDPELKIGDVVIGEEIIHHDADATAFGYAYGQIPQMPRAFHSDQSLLEIARDVGNDLLGEVQVKPGQIGTGDSFMSKEEKIKKVVELFPAIKALEMEAASIAQVCYQYGTPFLIIRSLSDIAGQQSSTSFDQYLKKAAKNSAALILKTIKSDQQK